MNKIRLRHPTNSEILKMTAIELGREIFDYREILKALEREKLMRPVTPTGG